MFVNKSKKRSKALSIFIVFSILVSFFPVALSFPTNVQAATTLKVYPAPAGVPLNGDYTVQVREPGGVWKDLDEYRTIVRVLLRNPMLPLFISIRTVRSRCQ